MSIKSALAVDAHRYIQIQVSVIHVLITSFTMASKPATMNAKKMCFCKAFMYVHTLSMGCICISRYADLGIWHPSPHEMQQFPLCLSSWPMLLTSHGLTLLQVHDIR